MQCQEIQESLSAYIDGMLDPPVMDMVGRHLIHCPVCRGEAEDLKMTVRMLQDLPLVEPPADFRPSLRAKLEQVAPAGKAGVIRKLAKGRWSGIVALAASFLLVVGTAASFWDGFPLQSGIREMAVKSDNYEVLGTASSAGSKGAAENKAEDQAGDGGSPPADLSASGPVRVQGGLKLYSSVKSDPGAGAQETIKRQKVTAAQEPEFRNEAVLLQAAKTAPDGNGVTGRGVASAPAATQPQLHKNAVIGLKVNDKTSATREFFGIANRYKGVAAILPDTGDREILLRVPEESFEKVISDVGKTGKIIREDYSGQAAASDLPLHMQQIETFGKGGSGPDEVKMMAPVSKDVYAEGAVEKKPDPARLDSAVPMATIRIKLE